MMTQASRTIRRTLALPLFTCLALTLPLSGCQEMQGMNVGGVDLSPLASAGQKLSQNNKVSEPQEQEIGAHMAGTLLGAEKLDRNAKSQRYVNRVGRWLTLHSSRPFLDWHFGVLADDDINAFAAPGGYVFVTRGLLNELQNEAELAGVLSHEISHVTHKHHLAALQSNNLMGAALDVGSVLGNAATGGRASAEQRELGARVVNATRDLYARGLDKSDEYDADQAALHLMSSAGYDPYAFIAVMQRLEQKSANDSSLALLLQTHPKPADRVKAMAVAIKDVDDNEINATLPERFHRELAR